MTIQFVELLHYSTVALVVAINSLGVGIGEGLTSSAAIAAINTQPSARNDITRTAILSMALIETAAIMGVIISILLLFSTQNLISTLYAGLANIGIGFAVCIAGFSIGLVSALPAREACFAIARQPFFANKIFRFMLVTQSIIQTPIIFGFIIALLIKNQAISASTLTDSLRLIASGLCIGLGCIGPAIGIASFAKTACQCLGINRAAYNQILSFTFISEAIVETPIILALVISLILLVTTITEESILRSVAMLAAALCTGIGTFGPGFSSGRTAAATCKQIAYQPQQYGMLARISMFSQGLIDTTAIYALLVSLLLLVQ